MRIAILPSTNSLLNELTPHIEIVHDDRNAVTIVGSAPLISKVFKKMHKTECNVRAKLDNKNTRNSPRPRPFWSTGTLPAHGFVTEHTPNLALPDPPCDLGQYPHHQSLAHRTMGFYACTAADNLDNWPVTITMLPLQVIGQRIGRDRSSLIEISPPGSRCHKAQLKYHIDNEGKSPRSPTAMSCCYLNLSRKPSIHNHFAQLHLNQTRGTLKYVYLGIRRLSNVTQELMWEWVADTKIHATRRTETPNQPPIINDTTQTPESLSKPPHTPTLPIEAIKHEGTVARPAPLTHRCFDTSVHFTYLTMQVNADRTQIQAEPMRQPDPHHEMPGYETKQKGTYKKNYITLYLCEPPCVIHWHTTQTSDLTQSAQTTPRRSPLYFTS